MKLIPRYIFTKSFKKSIEKRRSNDATQTPNCPPYNGLLGVKISYCYYFIILDMGILLIIIYQYLIQIEIRS
jgi:hypothetical protein